MQHDIIAAGRDPNLVKEKVKRDLVELLIFLFGWRFDYLFYFKVKATLSKFSCIFWPQILKMFTDTILFFLILR